MAKATRTLTAAMLALAAAGCGSGGAQTAAPSTTAPPAETAAAPTTTTTAAPAPPETTADRCAVKAAEAARARALMTQAEAAAGPPDAETITQIAEARWGSRFARGCEGIWTGEDEARLDELAGRTAAAPETPEPEGAADSDDGGE